MNYEGKKIFLTGPNSFIGRAVAVRLEELGADVYRYRDDVRDKQRLGELLSHKWDYVFHFGCPSSQVQFMRQKRFCVETTLLSFLHLSRLCAQNGIRLIYPSTGLLSQGKSNEYARCKQICEDLADTNELDSLGIRIFATYGPGEDHKRDYASVPYLFARDMVAGKIPIIYGDGKQTRDFIYIDDVVESIVILAEECSLKVIDVGSGDQRSFNEIVAEINDNLPDLDDIEPEYIPAPLNYVTETVANTQSWDFYQPKIGFEMGIAKLVKHLHEVQ